MDDIFNSPQEKQFEFDEKVASVFDDMIWRSIPFYKESLSLSTQCALHYLHANSSVIDLGTSTGQILLELGLKAPFRLDLCGIDNSAAMIQKARQKLQSHSIDARLICGDILQEDLMSADVIFANYTLQFIRPIYRQGLVEKIYHALSPKGAFLMAEKIISEHKGLDFWMIQHYLESKKKQGYSDIEITKKREALENVLIPYSQQENIAMLKKAGFSHVELLFCWVNFATFVALK